MHVLILEDNDHLRNLYTKVLTHHHHRVDSADTCAKMLALLAVTTPDLVLTDLELPDGSGLMIIDYIRHNAHLSKTKICAITGGEKYEHTGNFRADFFLLKPISTKLLSALIERISGAESTPVSRPLGIITSYR